MAKDRKKPEEKPPDSWEQFGNVVRAALSVPKEEVKESMEREKEEKKSKPVLHRKEVKKKPTQENARQHEPSKVAKSD